MRFLLSRFQLFRFRVNQDPLAEPSRSWSTSLNSLAMSSFTHRWMSEYLVSTDKSNQLEKGSRLDLLREKVEARAAPVKVILKKAINTTSSQASCLTSPGPSKAGQPGNLLHTDTDLHGMLESTGVRATGHYHGIT